MPTPFEISDRFTDAWAELDPIRASTLGVTGWDEACTDYSPDAHARRADLFRSTLSDLEPHAGDPDPTQAFAARVLAAWLAERIADFDAGKWRRDLNHIFSPFQRMRDVFDVMPRDEAGQWDAVTSRLEGFARMLEGYRESLSAGLEAGDTVAVRQATSLVDQLEAAASDESRFSRYPADAESVGADAVRVGDAVSSLKSACADMAGWMRSVYLPMARPGDAVGRERYLEGCDRFLGMDLDPEETYLWGWAEVHRLQDAMRASAREIDPELDVRDVIHMLETDPARSAGTREEFVEFVSSIQQQAIDQLAGTHFDVPDPLKTVTVSIAPPGGSLGAWYVGPSEDLVRPGSIWYAPGERARLPLWQEVTTAYHEGFPGHHLQGGTATMLRDELSRFHRQVIWYSGAGEGWALYAERLMDELGFFEKPEFRMGLLASQLFRSVRVVVDIGCQLELRIPDDAPLYAGEPWSYERAVDYVEQIGLHAHDVAVSEVKRYLGWWGQAISYKVGERELLDIRTEAQKAADFDLKGFHRKLLEVGAIRLDHLRELMS